jgi:heterodisulfide reductase subunit B
MHKDYVYYPGCALKTGAKHYDESVVSVFEKLGIHMKELEDWNCCGATAYFSVDEKMALAISGRNLALAVKEGKDIVAPCAGCYLTLRKSLEFLNTKPEKVEKIIKELEGMGGNFPIQIRVRHPLEVLINDYGLEKISEKVKRNLNGIRIACYYGCQLVRPFTDFDVPDYPVSLDNLMALTGAEVVNYSPKTRCCGGSLTGTIEEVGLRLNYILLKEAKKEKADAIVTICPLCQFNLEVYQNRIIKKYKEDIKLPIFYFTQILGLALDIPEKNLGFSRSLVHLNEFFARL